MIRSPVVTRSQSIASETSSQQNSVNEEDNRIQEETGSPQNPLEDRNNMEHEIAILKQHLELLTNRITNLAEENTSLKETISNIQSSNNNLHANHHVSTFPSNLTNAPSTNADSFNPLMTVNALQSHSSIPPSSIVNPSTVQSQQNQLHHSRIQDSTPNLPTPQTQNPNTQNIDRIASESPLQLWLANNSYQNLLNEDQTNTYSQQKLYDLPEFSGRPEEWPLFYSAFLETTKDFKYSNLQNTLRLNKCLKGKAKETVESLLINPNNVATVIQTLEFQYGRPELLLQSQLNLIRAIKPICETNLFALIEFSSKIQNFTCFLETMRNHTHHLTNPTILNEMVEKITVIKRTEWMKFAINISPFPSIRDFADWIYKEAQLLTLVMPTSTLTIQNERINVIEERKVVCPICKKEDHSIYICNIFKKKSINERWNSVKELNLCFSCLKQGHSIGKCKVKKECGIRECQKLHSKFLHSDEKIKNTEIIDNRVESNIGQERVENVMDENNEVIRVNERHCYNDSSRILFKILPVKIYGPKECVQTFAFIDEGSNTSLIDLDIAAEVGINLGKSKNFEVKWYNGEITSENCYEVEFNIGPKNLSDQFHVNGFKTVKNLDLPNQSLDLNSLPKDFENIKQNFESFKKVKPKILLGLKHCELFFPKISLTIDKICVTQCNLGWLLYGKNTNNEKECVNRIFMTNCISPDEDLRNLVKPYINNDSLEIEPSEIANNQIENDSSIKIMKETTLKIGDRFETGLLWKDEHIKLPNNLDKAFKRLKGIENKMKNDIEYAKKYEENLMQYVNKGYAPKLKEIEICNNSERIWYLPHFAAFNPNKPNKFRIVFDAAAKFNGVSLNDCLMKGPDLNQPMIKLILNFRMGNIGVGGDIKEMFPQIKIIKRDQDAQRFIWRHGDKTQPLEHYTMTSMTFGAACSPTSAQFVKNFNAKLHEQDYPDAAKAILNYHYVDDFVMSFKDIYEAEKITKEVIKIHKNGGFELTKFVSNSKELLDSLGTDSTEEDQIKKILGLYWDTTSDSLIYKVKFANIPTTILEKRRKPTKREVLSIVMSIFDPFGLLNNFTVHGRLLIQELWEHKCEWDSQIPDISQKKWLDFLNGLFSIESIKIPRCVSTFNIFNASNIQLHIFTDASDKVYSAVAYIRVSFEEKIEVMILASKVRIKSNKKSVSIPRMELQGAVLGSKLQNIIMENLTFITKNNVIFWTDSKVVLHWINTSENIYKPFVSHRIQVIKNACEIGNWRYIPSKLNVADDATKRKGKLVVSLSSRWIVGPDFLSKPSTEWPMNCRISKIPDECLDERRKNIDRINVMIESHEAVINFTKFSSFRKLCIVMGWVFKAINHFKKNKKNKYLSIEELRSAENFIIKRIQIEHFYLEIECIQNKIQLPKSSSIRKLCPFLDKNGILRAKGRLENALYLPYFSRHPIILPKKNQITTLIIQQYHKDFLHQNANIVMNEIRVRYLIPCLKQQLKYTEKSCNFCKIKNALPSQPMMSPLPVERVTPFVRAFSFCGMDYCGPFWIKHFGKMEKIWIVLFTCMNTRAIHLETSNSLKSTSCLIALSNFMNRRGVPMQIRTDNATYFRSSKKRLREILTLDDLESVSAKYKVKWVFNTPDSPHMGGAWERLILCVRKVLEVTLNEQVLNKELFTALIIQAENIINSRPLTDVPIENEFSEYLTPNHFLLGELNSFQTPTDDDEIKIKLPKQFRILKQMKHTLWVKWIKQYLPELTKRCKWFENTQNIKLDELVLICDPKSNYRKWERGRVTKLFPGKDGIVRSVEIKTTSVKKFH